MMAITTGITTKTDGTIAPIAMSIATNRIIPESFPVWQDPS
jgi:hypothetical protein